MLENLEANIQLETVEAHFKKVRQLTESLCEPLEIEDYGLQAMAETSPVKWHLAHTSWFFETFILKQFATDFTPYNSQYEYLFNSYYNSVGEQFPRPKRHLLSRPTVKQIYSYRKFVTDEVLSLLRALSKDDLATILPLVVLGINHEQQHQELLLSDLKYNLYQNPLLPAYRNSKIIESIAQSAPSIKWIPFESGMTKIGADYANNSETFIFDNETPAHQVYLQAYELSNRLVTNQEYIEFIESGGYERSELWLSDGWDLKQQSSWSAPLYWFKDNDRWFQYTLDGVKEVQTDKPVCHVSLYEADAFASWMSARLPTEEEWERAASDQLTNGNFLQSEALEPQAAGSSTEIQQLFGDVWEWTQSSYSAYPGFKPLDGAIGEYNGKFMANQFVLRGGSCVTSQDHIRSTYRNFFYPDARWQFSGFRLARDLEE